MPAIGKNGQESAGEANNEMIQASESPRWQSSFSLQSVSSATPQADIALTLKDHTGNPVTGKAVLLNATHQHDTNQVVKETLREIKPGVYGTHFIAKPAGQWCLHFTAQTNDGSEFTETRYISLR